MEAKRLEALEDEDEKGPQEGWVYVKRNLQTLSDQISKYLGGLLEFVFNTSIYRDYIEPIIAISQTESGFLSLVLFVVASFLGNFYGV